MFDIGFWDFNRELQTGDLHKILGDQKEQINELRSMVASTRKELETSTSDALSAAKTQIQSLEDIANGGSSRNDTPALESKKETTDDPAQDATVSTPNPTNDVQHDATGSTTVLENHNAPIKSGDAENGRSGSD